MPSRYFRTASVSVHTFMPGITVVVQPVMMRGGGAGASGGVPGRGGSSTATKHIRQAPTTGSREW